MLGFNAIAESAIAELPDNGYLAVVVSPTGTSVTTSLGDVSIVGSAVVSVSGFSATLSQGYVIVWGNIIPAPGTSYSTLTPSSSPTWSTVSTGASQTWTEKVA